MGNSFRPPSILSAARSRWGEHIRTDGLLPGSWHLFLDLWGFLRDSTPSRRRSRFGDADYDWDYRVNTTSGAVSWRDRLLGVFHSPYQPTERALFHEIVNALAEVTRIDFRHFTFFDLGSGKGRVLLMASDYPFHKIVGVELLPSLHEIALENIAGYHNEAQKCFVIESVCADATEFELPDVPLVLYLFNPFPESGLRRAIESLERSLVARPREVYVLYHNPQLEPILNRSRHLSRIAGTHQYSIFAAKI